MKENKKTLFEALKLAWNLGYTITLPLVVFAIAGRWLDRKIGTSPWLFIGGVILSIFVSSLAIYFKIVKIIAQKSSEDKK